MANVVTLLAVFLVRFGISDRFIYEGEKNMAQAETAPTKVGPIQLVVEEDSRPELKSLERPSGLPSATTTISTGS